jgi:hypothetical protein
MRLMALCLVTLAGCCSVATADCVDAAATAIQQRGVTDWVISNPTPTLEEIYQNSSTSETLIGYRAWFRVARRTKDMWW